MSASCTKVAADVDPLYTTAPPAEARLPPVAMKSSVAFSSESGQYCGGQGRLILYHPHVRQLTIASGHCLTIRLCSCSVNVNVRSAQGLLNVINNRGVGAKVHRSAGSMLRRQAMAVMLMCLQAHEPRTPPG